MYAWSTLGSTLKRTVSSSAQQLSGSSPFSPKIPNFNLPTPKYVFKDCLQVYELKGAFRKTHQTWNQMLFQHNSPIQPIFTKPSTTTPFIPQICNYEHPRYELSTTTTTSIKHEFINNPSTTIHSTSILCKTQVYMYIHHRHIKFNINNLIIFKFIYPNIASKHKHEFHQLKSQ